MAKHRFLLLLLLNLNICFIAQGQVDTATYDNKIIVHSYQTDKFIFPFIFEDYDSSDNLCFSLTMDTAVNIYYVDNNLNVQNVLNAEKRLFFYYKLNDKLYGVMNFQHSYNKHDSTYFYANDLNGERIFSRQVFSNDDPNKIYFMYNCFLTRNKEVVFLLRDYDLTNDQYGAKLFVIDTLGEIIASKSINQVGLSPNAIYETDSNFTILCSNLRNDIMLPKAYYIDKISLNIVDSAEFVSKYYNGKNKKINDSILVSVSTVAPQPYSSPNRYTIQLINYKNLTIQSKIVEPGGAFISEEINQLFQNAIDFINEDSIYYCSYIRNSNGMDGDLSGFIYISNFGINGELNFEYKFIYDSLVPKVINGVKATDDGGLLVMIQLLTDDCWLLKFSPDGLIGLTNIETGEKETIKVYPNPARDYINIDIECRNFKQSDIELFDMQGKLVKKAKLKSKQGNRIDVSNLNVGAYTYNVSLNGKTINGKIIVGK